MYWRTRLAESKQPHRVSDAVKTVVEQAGILRGRRRRAVDSMILAGAVARAGTDSVRIAELMATLSYALIFRRLTAVRGGHLVVGGAWSGPMCGAGSRSSA